jgi:hypothetical protein
MEQQPANAKRKLIVTELRPLSTFTRQDGSEGQLYEVLANAENGVPIAVPLRTFAEDLPIGQLIEYEVEPYDHPRHGTSYTLKLPRRSLGPRVSKLEARTSELEGRVERIEGRLHTM